MNAYEKRTHSLVFGSGTSRDDGEFVMQRSGYVRMIENVRRGIQNMFAC